MKKIPLFFVIVGLFCGCRTVGSVDSFSYNYDAWANNSEHIINVSVSTELGYIVEFELSPNEKYEIVRTNRGFSPPFFQETDLVFDSAYDVSFGWGHDGHGSVLLPEGYDNRYNPLNTELYAMETVKDPEGCKQCAGARWTYTFTNADFEAAKEYNEAQAAAE